MGVVLLPENVLFVEKLLLSVGVCDLLSLWLTEYIIFSEEL